MAYLIPADYNKQIQDANLQQIISNDTSVLNAAQLAAQAEAISYLRQKYDTSKEFADLNVWSIAKTYYAGDRFYLNATAYSATSTYALNALTLYQNNVYKCTTAITVAEAFNPTKWLLLGYQYQIFSAVLPHNEFDYGGYYNVNDKVFWKNNVYDCLVQTPLLGHDTGIQYRNIDNLPLKNVAPDDPIEGKNYWGNKIAYLVPAGTLPTNTTYYAAADNRDQQMVMYFIDITLYHVHTRIAPRNIPDIRVKRYDDAIAWLKMCANGDVTPNLPVIKPAQGRRIRYGGGIKLINSY